MNKATTCFRYALGVSGLILCLGVAVVGTLVIYPYHYYQKKRLKGDK
jgi:uncharacterized membrane-anchored protein